MTNVSKVSNNKDRIAHGSLKKIGGEGNTGSRKHRLGAWEYEDGGGHYG